MEKQTDFTIDCTGNCVTGDTVRFERAVFTGSYPRSKFSGYETIEGTIIKDSYGKSKGQHTFTIEKKDGNTLRIKGRNLYKNGVLRQKWTDETERDQALNAKYARKPERIKKTFHVEGSPGFYYPVCDVCGKSDEQMMASDKSFVPPPSCGC